VRFLFAAQAQGLLLFASTLCGEMLETGRGIFRGTQSCFNVKPLALKLCYFIFSALPGFCLFDAALYLLILCVI
jgi:hypothetical protein